MKEPIILIGGGGHCKSVIDVIESQGRYRINGIVDVKSKVGSDVLGYPIIAEDQDLPELIEGDMKFLLTVGQIQNLEVRKRQYHVLNHHNASFGIVISPSARIGKNVQIGEGTVVLHNAHLNSDARIGRQCIVNSGVLVEHDSVVGDFCHLAPRAVLNGSCQIGEGSFIGSNSTIVHQVNICENVVIGASSVVLSDIESPGVYVGNPTRKIHE